jgi:hypothetical protein
MAGALQELARLLATFRKVGPAYEAADAHRAAADLTALAKAAATPEQKLLFNGQRLSSPEFDEVQRPFRVPTEPWWGTTDAAYATSLADGYIGRGYGALHLLGLDPRSKTRIAIPWEPGERGGKGYHWDPGDLWYRDPSDIVPEHYSDHDTVRRAVEKLKAKPRLIEWDFTREPKRSDEWTIDPSVPTKRYASGGPVLPSDAELSKLEQWQLLGLRKQFTDPADQARLAGWEHRAYARDAAARSPLMAASAAVATPAYQVAKMLPRSLTGMRSRTDPSWEQMMQGWRGVGEGLGQWWGGR